VIHLRSRLIFAPLLAALLLAGLGGGYGALAKAPPLRGRMVDIGEGRLMHIVCEGPAGAGPTIVFESGAWGFSADWGAVQQMTTQRGWRSCAYDRAGMGYSQPGPGHRDGLAISGDLARLLSAAGEPGPYILVGHSMAGLYAPLFARRYPDRVVGLVLADPSVPDQEPEGLLATVQDDSFWGAIAGSLGLLKPFGARYGDRMGLPPAAKAEKIHVFGKGAHARTAFAEEQGENAAALQVIAAGPLDPALPAAVITAGPERPDRPGRKTLQARIAEQSRHGYVRNIEAASHNSLLGLEHGAAIVDGIAHVRAALR
jgi:pimeloyl-ACP methyl ester carboxylesterase